MTLLIHYNSAEIRFTPAVSVSATAGAMYTVFTPVAGGPFVGRVVYATVPQACDFFNPLFAIQSPIPQKTQDHGYRSGPVLMFAGRHQVPKFALKLTGNRTGEDDDVASLGVGIVLQREAGLSIRPGFVPDVVEC